MAVTLGHGREQGRRRGFPARCLPSQSSREDTRGQPRLAENGVSLKTGQVCKTVTGNYTKSFQLGTSSERHQVLGTSRGTHFVTRAVDGACGFQTSRVPTPGRTVERPAGWRPCPLPGPPPQGQARGEVTPLLLTLKHRALPPSPPVLGTKAPANQRPTRWRQERLRDHLSRGYKYAGPTATTLQTPPGRGRGDRQEESPRPRKALAPTAAGAAAEPHEWVEVGAVPGKGQADSDSRRPWVTRLSSP